ncbi:MAG: hypothetical protein ACXABY_25180 [Candidatus Thorarchaeota archaeon]|jgi:hypothetical protein
MVRFCIEDKPHSAVLIFRLYLTAGKIYIFETRDLKSSRPGGFPFPPPDTYMYLCRGNYTGAASGQYPLTIAAKNNDYYGRASLVVHSPAISSWYSLVVRAYYYWGQGQCDVYRGIDGSAPVRIAYRVKFGGYPIAAHWKGDEKIDAEYVSGIPRLLLINDEESEMFFCNKYASTIPGSPTRIIPGREDYGLVILASRASTVEGRADVCNYYMSYLDNPGKEKPKGSKVIVSDAMAKFIEKLEAEEESLSELPVTEQDEKIQKLRDKMLSKKEIEIMRPPEIEPPKGLKKANERYSKLLADMEPTLEALSMEERMEEMSILQERKRRLFKGIVPVRGRF